MAGFNDTMELERSFFSIMLKSKMQLKNFANRMKAEFFTTKERKFIRECIVKTLKDTNGLLTKTVFDYEVHSRIDDREQHFYEGEWTIISGLNPTEDPEVILDRLQKAFLGRQLLDVAEGMVEMVEKGEIDGAIRQLRIMVVKLADKKKSPPLMELTDYRHRLDLIHDKREHPEKYLGIKTGFSSFDKRTGGLFPKEFTLFSCITGTGKSTLLRQIESGIVLNNEGKNVLHICNEEHTLQVQTKFDAQLTRIPYLDFKLATITDEDLDKWKTQMEIAMKKPGVGRIFIKECPAYSDVTLIEDAVNELMNLGIKIHVIIIDHLPHVKPIEQAWGEYDEQGKAAADCWELGRAYDVSVVSATQAATIVEEKQAKGRRAGKMDVYGSKEQVHVANTSVAITLIGRDDTQLDREEWERDVFWLCDIKKNRDGPPFSFKARHHVRFGFIEEIFDKGKQTDNALKKAEEEAEKEANEALEEAKMEEINKKAGEVEEPEIPSLDSYPQVGFCGVPGCGEPVYDTPSGTSCTNGHGGAKVLKEPPVEPSLPQEIPSPIIEVSPISGWLARKKNQQSA